MGEARTLSICPPICRCRGALILLINRPVTAYQNTGRGQHFCARCAADRASRTRQPPVQAHTHTRGGPREQGVPRAPAPGGSPNLKIRIIQTRPDGQRPHAYARSGALSWLRHARRRGWGPWPYPSNAAERLGALALLSAHASERGARRTRGVADPPALQPCLRAMAFARTAKGGRGKARQVPPPGGGGRGERGRGGGGGGGGGARRYELAAPRCASRLACAPRLRAAWPGAALERATRRVWHRCARGAAYEWIARCSCVCGP